MGRTGLTGIAGNLLFPLLKRGSLFLFGFLVCLSFCGEQDANSKVVFGPGHRLGDDLTSNRIIVVLLQ